MGKKLKIIVLLIGITSFIMMSIFVQPQEGQKVILRYKANVGDIWKYECITESESDRTAPTQGKSLRYIKENFGYEVIEITPENHIKVRLNAVPIESKGVNIRAGKKEEMHDFVAPRSWEEILTPTGEILECAFIDRPRSITETLTLVYEDMIKYFHPVMPEEEIGINSDWNYEVAVIPVRQHGMEIIARENPILSTYKTVAFEKKDGFDCVKIEYNYKVDYTDKLRAELVKDEKMKNYKWELKVEGLGTFYFAYNEGFVISRKENLIKTDIRSKLVDENWKTYKKIVKRIGFTMNYIKP